MSGYPTSMIGLCQEGKSAPEALGRSAGVKLFGLQCVCRPRGQGCSRWRTNRALSFPSRCQRSRCTLETQKCRVLPVGPLYTRPHGQARPVKA